MKHADIKSDVKTQDHQDRVKKKLENITDGLIVVHGLGSGKTFTSINAAEDHNEVDVVVPASLRENYKKEIEKFTNKKNRSNYDVMSYNATAKGVADKEKDLLVLDEAHRARNQGTKQVKHLMDGVGNYKKRMLLTGTPIYNRPDDLVNQLRLASGDPNLISHDSFNENFLTKQKSPVGFINKYFRGMKDGEVTVMKNQKKFRKDFGKYFDYHMSQNPEDFPEIKNETHFVEMTKKQSDVYNGVLGNSVMAIKVRKNLPPDKKESKQLNAFAGAIRQISNSPHNYIEGMEFDINEAPKLKTVVKNIKNDIGLNPQSKGVVYSNYLETLDQLSESLRDAGVENLVYTGKLNDKQKKEIVDRYNNPDDPLSYILISSSGGEGLDLKGTRTVDIVEPHWNEEKINQVKGRAARYKSHEGMKPEDKNVRMRNYYSTPKKTTFQTMLRKKRDTGIDEYLKAIGERKTNLNNQFLKQIEKSTDEYIQGKAATIKIV